MTTPCRLSATTYSIYSHLLFISGGLFSISNLRTPDAMETGPTSRGRRWNHQNLCDNLKSSRDSVCSVLYIPFSSCQLALFGYLVWGFFHAFSSVARQMPEYNSQRRGTARTLPKLIVLFCVLFGCKCVLYYCHRVSTQLHLTNISTWVISKVLHTVSFLFKNEFILQKTFKCLQCNLHCALSQRSNVWASLIFLSGRLRFWCVWLLRSPH
jgi:hypothetical protein